MIQGSCYCGAVKFQLSAAPTMMGLCHCSRCRKAGASALAFVDQASFSLTTGKDFIQRHEPEPPFKHARSFCKRCGTALGDIGAKTDSFPISVNCLDDDPGLKPQFHVHVASKPAWYDINDDAVQFQGDPD